MVETRKRKSVQGSDGNSVAARPSRSGDAARPSPSGDAEADTKRKPTSNTTKATRRSADSGPHVCKYCHQRFQLSQALGGHMNRHRKEKQEDEMRRAESLVARNRQYMVNSSYILQGGGGGGGGVSNMYYTSILPNPSGSSSMGTPRPYHVPNQAATMLYNMQVNPTFALQQNAQVSTHTTQQEGTNYYDPLDNTTTHYSQRNTLSLQQFQGQHLRQVVQTNTMQPPHDQTVFQGDLSDNLQHAMLNMSSNHPQQAQPDVPFVDPQENPVQQLGLQYGHDSHALPQDYVVQPTSFQVQNFDSCTSISGEHIGGSSTHSQRMFGMPNLVDGLEFHGDMHQSSTNLMESGQDECGPDTSIDDHTSGRHFR